MSNTWAVVVAALGAALLSTGGAFILDARRASRLADQANTRELKEACAQIISGAQRLLFKAAALHISMEVRSGLRERLDLLLHHRKPIDILELNDYLMIEQGKILDAQATLWLIGNEVLIQGAGDIVNAVGKMITAATALPAGYNESGALLRNLKPLKFDTEIEAKVNESARSMGLACVTFGHAMRSALKTEDVDAILRAMPGFSIQAVRDDASFSTKSTPQERGEVRRNDEYCDTKPKNAESENGFEASVNSRHDESGDKHHDS
jgi:hypothetical protein